MRPDRRQRVDLRPDCQGGEERDEETDDGRDEHLATEAEEERSDPCEECECDDNRRRVVDADGAQRERPRQRYGSDEQGSPAGDRRVREHTERGERHEPAHEHQRRARPRVVGTGEPDVEACQRRHRVGGRAGPNRWSRARSDRDGSGRDVGEGDEPVDPRRARHEQAAVPRSDDRDGVSHDVVVRPGRREREVDRRLGRYLCEPQDRLAIEIDE